MILPQSQLAILLVAILAMLCLGIWASAYKFGTKWRFELFYVDLALGAFLATLIYAFTVGNMGFDGFSVLDDISRAGKRSWVLGFAAGVVFNLGNLFLMAAISVTGMSVAFPISIGMAILGGVAYRIWARSSGNVPLLIAGALLIVAMIVVDIAAYFRLFALSNQPEDAPAGQRQRRRARPVPSKGPLLAVAGGVFMIISVPLLNLARVPEIGLGPYSLGVFFMLGLLLSTGLFCLFFMTLPVEGEPLEVLDILKVHPLMHLVGMAGGAIWATGMIASFIVQDLPAEQPAPWALVYSITPVAALIASLVGLGVWKDFRNGDGGAKALALSTLALFAVAAAILGVAQNG